MFRHILLATDGSAASEQAAHLAVHLARAHGAILSALFVVEPFPYFGATELDPMGYQAYLSAAGQLAAEAHAKVRELCAQAPAVEFHPLQRDGTGAPAAILQAAAQAQADLIVVGSHGRSGIARLMLGSVAARVVAESPIPVLVAR